MNDETMTQFVTMISHALKQWRDGDWLLLSQSPLIESDLVGAALLPNEPRTMLSLARAIQTTLRWGIAQLKPSGEQDWLANRWRQYNLLHHYYELGWLAADVAEQLAIAEQTFYDWRNQAVTLLSHTLFEEAQHAQLAEQRKQFAILSHYDSLDSDSRRLLRLLATVPIEHPLALDWLPRLLPDSDNRASLATLESHYLLQQAGQRLMVALPVRAALQQRLSAEERIGWLVQLARIYRQTKSPLAAAECYAAAGEHDRSARLLIEQWQTLVNQQKVTEMQPLLTQLLATPQLEGELIAALYLVAGKSAEYLDDLPSAIDAYGHALATDNLLQKAQAYHRRAKVYQRVDLDQCLNHYQVCIDLLNRQPELSSELQRRLAQMLIDRGWINLQERLDFTQADADLNAAQALITPNDSETWARLYDARSGLHVMEGNSAGVIQTRMRAWIAAEESQNSELMMHIAHNLGQDYIWDDQHEKGREFLNRSLAIATASDNLQLQGMGYKGLGASFALQEQYEQAVAFYLQAHKLFVQTKNPNWRLGCCYDLTEAFAELSRWEEARAYFAEGRQLADELGHQRQRQQFAALIEKYPSLVATVNDRQQQAINYLHDHAAISRADYVKLTDVSKSQAHRDLEELIEQGVIERVGKGRATRYVLVSH